MRAFFLLLSLFAIVAAAVPRLSENCPAPLEKKGAFCVYPEWVLGRLSTNPVLAFHPPDKIRPKLVSLGRLLFFDPILSSDGSRSCASCHDPRHSFSDGRAVSAGLTGPLTRSSPPLWNVAFYRSLFWDGRAASLESQAEGPLYHPNEMGMTPGALEKRLQSSEYPRLFAQVFGTPETKAERAIAAITEFERTLVSLDSRYDRYLAGERGALSTNEENGMRVFRSFVARCTECHEPPLFTNFEMAAIGVPEPRELEDLGIERLLPRFFRGRGNRGSFRVPSLRNIARTAPYMHSGSLTSLTEVVEFYNRGGGRRDRLPPGRTIHWHIRPMGLVDQEVADLTEFLQSLTDESYLPEAPTELPRREMP